MSGVSCHWAVPVRSGSSGRVARVSRARPCTVSEQAARFLTRHRNGPDDARDAGRGIVRPCVTGAA